MGAKGNTTPIGDGSVGIDNSVTSAAGQAIQEVVSENNLKANLAANGSMKNIFGATIRMVARWAPGDKMRILQDYGSVDMVKKNASDEEINNAVATVLISHLPKEELRKIIGKEEVTEKKITKDVAAINQRSLNFRKKQFNANAFGASNQAGASGTARNNLVKNSNDDKQLLKGLKNQGAAVTKADSTEFKRIRKELEEVLKGMTNIQLATIAANLGMSADDTDGSMSKKTTIKYICNMVNMYTILLLGKDTSGISPAKFSKEVVAQIEELLLLTSGGWMTGKVGINDLTLREKRKAAMAAKKELKANKEANDIKAKARAQAESIKRTRGGKIKYDSSGNIKMKSGFLGIKKKDNAHLNANTKKMRDLIIKKLGGGDIDKVDMNALKNLAASQGIEGYEDKTKTELLDELALYAAKESEGVTAKSKEIIDKAKKEAAKYVKSDPEKAKQIMANAKKEVTNTRSASFLGALEKGEEGSQEYSDKIPVISFSGIKLSMTRTTDLSTGDDIYSGKLTGIAKFHKGGFGAGKIQSNADATAAKDADKNAIATKVNAEYDGAGGFDAANAAHEESKAGNKFKSGMKAIGSNLLDVATFGISGAFKEARERKEAEAEGMYATGATSFIAGDSLTDKANPERVTIKGDGSFSVEPVTSGPQNNNSPFALDQYATGKLKGTSTKDSPIVFMKSLKKYVSKHSRDLFSSALLNRRDKIQPVYAVNKGFEFIDNGLKENLKSTASAMQQVASQVEQIPTMMMGLQQGGTAFNAEAAASGVAMALNIANQAATSAAQFATGGSMRGGNKVSQIITGDHPAGKNNTELVSVDWTNKNINVKPIPMMATGGDVQSNAASNITNVKRMTSSERSKPMQVSISSGVVKYDKTLSDVKDDGTSTAVKVYSVNSGITEKIQVGDTEMSLFDAVYGVYSSMAALVAGVSTSNQLLASISGTSAASVKAINRLNSAQNGNGSPFSFTTELDDVLAGR